MAEAPNEDKPYRFPFAFHISISPIITKPANDYGEYWNGNSHSTNGVGGEQLFVEES